MLKNQFDSEEFHQLLHIANSIIEQLEIFIEKFTLNEVLTDQQIDGICRWK